MYKVTRYANKVLIRAIYNARTLITFCLLSIKNLSKTKNTKNDFLMVLFNLCKTNVPLLKLVE